jgi:uncharacterized RDD family membrane protein YckC
MTRFHGIGRLELNMTRGMLGLMAVCFMSPFFTFTLSSCGGTDASQALEVTGVDLLRRQHGPVENRTDHAPPSDRLGEVEAAADSGRDQAIAAILFAALAFAGSLLPRGARGIATLVGAAGAMWSLGLLQSSVQVTGVDVSSESGFTFAVLFAIGATAGAAVVPFRDGEVAAVPDRAPAGFWLRFSAWLLDAVAVFGLCVPVAFVVGRMTDHAVPTVTTVIAVILAYRIGLEASPIMGTLGARVVGIQVTGPNGTRLRLRRAAARAICELGCLVGLLGLGHAAAGVTTGKRAVHDALTETRVVRRAREATPVEAAGEPAPAGA